MKWYDQRYVLAAGLLAASLLQSSSAQAVAHVTDLRGPLTPNAYPHCPVDERDPVVDPGATSDIDEETWDAGSCSGSYSNGSPWTFSDGAFEFDSGSVALRLDDVRLKSGATCPVSGTCRCWGSNYGTCNDNSQCSPGDYCGPNADSSGNFTVRIWQQAYHNAGGGYLCGNGGCCKHIQRSIGGQCDADGCYLEVDFTTKNVAGNRNKQVNDTITGVETDCGDGSHPVEVRHIEIVDRNNNVTAAVTK